MKELYHNFIFKLNKLYGKHDPMVKRFVKKSNSEIARELGYSDAQFSRLMNESATEGEYQRALQNLDRIMRISYLEDEIGKKGAGFSQWQKGLVWFSFSLLLISGILLLIVASSWKSTEMSPQQSRDHTLKWTYENAFINPYLNLDDLPDDCNYPCYKYQGNWSLKKGYKIPFFRERNGFHYLATEVNMYARCMPQKSENGDMMDGYEYQRHEIWYDTTELPLDSFTTRGNQLRDFYQDLDFSERAGFIKVAIVHTFFRNEFILEDSLIHRSGQVIGRDLEFVAEDELLEKFEDSRLMNNIKLEINHIVSNRLKDFSRPISCLSAVVPDQDFHAIQEGAEMSFSCQLTTNRISFHYTKTFVLDDQYIENRCQTFVD